MITICECGNDSINGQPCNECAEFNVRIRNRDNTIDESLFDLFNRELVSHDSC